jgi:hypothetical protein
MHTRTFVLGSPLDDKEEEGAAWLAESREQQWVRGYLPGPMTEQYDDDSYGRNRPRLKASLPVVRPAYPSVRVYQHAGALPSE